jgi:hypothetical protein
VIVRGYEHLTGVFVNIALDPGFAFGGNGAFYAGAMV